MQMPYSKQTTYSTTVRRLRALATEAVQQYPIKVRTLDFIKYTANAIFKVTDTRNKKYILRVHSTNYHTKQAILEEIKWLHHILKTTDISVPKPISTSDGQYVIERYNKAISSVRFCAMFEWLPGKIRWKSIDRKYAYNLGAMIAKLQKNGKGITLKHRHYWNADGLVGTEQAKFYNVEKLTEVSQQEQTIITQARQLTYQKLKHYEKSYKDKIGLIHGDMQPNNFLYNKNNYSVIDFDDSGVGLYGDDLAVALFAFEYLTEGEKRKDYAELKEALYEGYSTFMPFTQQDLAYSPYFLLARKLVSIGWLEIRRDNPKIRAYFREAVTRAIRFFKGLEKHGH